MNDKIWCFDLWQTLCDIRYNPFVELYNSLDCKDITFTNFFQELSQCGVFTINNSIEDIIMKSKSVNKSNVSKCLIKEIWCKAAQSAYLYESTLSVLEFLKNKNEKIILISDIDKFGYEHFKFPYLLKYFDQEILSFQVNKSKPHLLDFQLIKTQSKSNNYVMIGDNIHKDIEPALRQGAVTYHVRDMIDIQIIKDIYYGDSKNSIKTYR